MGYDKKSFLTGLAVGRNMNSFPTLDASTNWIAVRIFWTNQVWPAKLSTDEPTEYIGVGNFLSADVKVFMMYNTTSGTYRSVFIASRDDPSWVNRWNETRGYTSDVDYVVLAAGRAIIAEGMYGGWYFGGGDFPTNSAGAQLIIDTNMILTGTMDDLATFLGESYLITVGDNLYLVGRGS